MSSKPASSSAPPRLHRSKNQKRDHPKAAVENSDKTDGAYRDLAHGEGGSIGLPVGPNDLNHDD